MKKILFLILVSFVTLSSYSQAEKFLEVPVIQQGKELSRTEARLEIKTDLSHDAVLSFYREALKGYEDIKFRDWKDSTYIEDDGNRPWHSITISKEDRNGSTVFIMKDNWSWIIGTLVLRYIGVFVVLMILLLAMVISGKIISASFKGAEEKRAEKNQPQSAA